MQTLKHQPVADPQTWRDALVLRNAMNFDNPMSFDESQEHVAHHPKESRWIRELLRDEREALVYISIFDPWWLQGDAGMQVSICPRNRQADQYHLGLDRIYQIARDCKTHKLTTWVQTVYPDIQELLLSQGFREVQRNVQSALDLTMLSLGNPEAGCEVVSYAAWRDRWPETWLHDVYRLEMDIGPDIPMTGEYKEMSFEQFKSEVFSSVVDLDLCFLAVVDGELAALSQIITTPAAPELGRTGLTGTRRAYRRRGLARALKIVSLNAARDKGITRVVTDNEVDNPMWNLNVELGFRRDYDHVAYILSEVP